MRYKVCNCGGIDFEVGGIIKALLEYHFPERNWNKCTHWIEIPAPPKVSNVGAKDEQR